MSNLPTGTSSECPFCSMRGCTASLYEDDEMWCGHFEDYSFPVIVLKEHTFVPTSKQKLMMMQIAVTNFGVSVVLEEPHIHKGHYHLKIKGDRWGARPRLRGEYEH